MRAFSLLKVSSTYFWFRNFLLNCIFLEEIQTTERIQTVANVEEILLEAANGEETRNAAIQKKCDDLKISMEAVDKLIVHFKSRNLFNKKALDAGPLFP
jgi:hypothetical protein